MKLIVEVKDQPKREVLLDGHTSSFDIVLPVLGAVATIRIVGAEKKGPAPVTVEKGQRWESCDPRNNEPLRPGGPDPLLVLEVGDGFARVRNEKTGKETQILLRRMRPGSSGYRLIPPEMVQEAS